MKLQDVFKKIFMAAAVALPIQVVAQVAPTPTTPEGEQAAYDAAAGYLYRGSDSNADGIPCFTFENPDTTGMCGTTGSSKPVALDTYYNTFQNEFYLQVKYPKNSDGNFPEGLVFVINNGDMPTVSGQWAIVYVDASKNIAAPILTTYAYNGAGGGQGILSSWQYGNQAESAPADRIITTLNPPANFHTGSWATGFRAQRQVMVRDYTETNVASPLNGVELREYTVNIDVTPINNHSPVYPQGASWGGIEIGGNTTNPRVVQPQIGAWIWGFNGLNTSYDSTGYLTGWLRAANLGFTFSSFELLFKNIGYAPIDCTGTIWGSTPMTTCGNPTPTPALPPECTTQSFTNNLFALDGGAAGLNEAVKYGAKRAVAIAGSKGIAPRVAQRLRTRAEAAQTESESLFLSAWSTAWSFPQFITQCTGTLTANCFVESLSARTTSYLDATQKIEGIAQRVVRLLRNSRSRAGSKAATRVETLAQTRLQEAVDFTKTVPSSTVQCVAP